MRVQNSPTNFDTQNSYHHDQPQYREDRRPTAQDYKSSSRSNSRNGTRTKGSIEAAAPPQGGLRPPPQEHQDLSGASSEADSLLDLYRSNGPTTNVSSSNGTSVNGTQRKRVASQDRSRVRSKGPRGAASVVEGPTREDAESKWIHRDKLAQIESREMAEIGVRLGRPSRAGSRAKSTKTNKSVVDGEMNEDMRPDEDAATRESKKLRQVVDEDMQEHRYHNETIDTSNDAFANTFPQRSAEKPTNRRPSTSRIPVPLSAAASPDDGDSPLELTRKRSGSLLYQRQHARSRSGSQNLLDATVKQGSPSNPNTRTFGSQVASPQLSPRKNRHPSSATPESNGRKFSTMRNASGKSNGRTDTSIDSPRRPTTSGGRPPTARPEGDPPWIATMYKPDPRLPPEEQMLPTHARRMAEMQADAQRHGPQPDSEYTLLEPQESNPPDPPRRSGEKNPVPPQLSHDPPYQPPNGLQETGDSFQRDIGQGSLNRTSWQQRSSMSDKQEQGQWPLRTPSGHSVYPSHRQQQPTSPTKNEPISPDHGGYNLMPTIPTPTKEQFQQSYRNSHRSHRSVQSISNMSQKEQQANAAQAPVHQPVRLQEDEPEEDLGKKEKGCAKCCVVM